MSAPYLTRLEGPSPAAEVARDLVKRGIWVAPLMVLAGAAIWSTDGAASVAFGIALVLVNFALSAFLIASTSRISLSLMMAAVLFGFLIRLGIIFAAVWLVKDASWMSIPALGATIIVTHLGLLFWELRYVSASLAFPGLKPTAGTKIAGENLPRVPTGVDTQPDTTQPDRTSDADSSDTHAETYSDTNSDLNKEPSQP